MVIYNEDVIEKRGEVEFKPIEQGVAILVNGIECGYIKYGVVQNRMEIIDLYVCEDYREKGYAKQLMWYALSTEGLDEVRLYPYPSFRMGEKTYLNKDALKVFYNNFCFGDTGKLHIIQRL